MTLGHPLYAQASRSSDLVDITKDVGAEPLAVNSCNITTSGRNETEPQCPDLMPQRQLHHTVVDNSIREEAADYFDGRSSLSI